MGAQATRTYLIALHRVPYDVLDVVWWQLVVRQPFRIQHISKGILTCNVL